LAITSGVRMASHSLKLQQFSRQVFLEKYAKGEEQTLEDVQARVARALAAVEQVPSRWEREFFQAQRDGMIMGGRVNSAAGTPLQATLINSFVQPVGDSVSETADGKPGIFLAQQQAAETMGRGGGVGYDFSSIRPRGAAIRSTRSRASGPVAYLQLFDAMCKTVESAGTRRGAQMGVLRIDHPDVEAFIHAKDKPGELTQFNLSVAITNAFMRALETDANFELTHKAKPGPDQIRAGAYRRADKLWVYRRVRARELWEAIMQSTYDHAEPGVLFLDPINSENNLWYCETIEASNPCAEQMLPDYGCCCLGSINLTRFVRQAFTEQASFDFDKFERVVKQGVRMLDNVLDTTLWPLDEQRDEAMAKRRIGLGYLGLGDALVMLGHRYDSPAGRKLAVRITQRMARLAYWSSIELAKEKGAFPLLDVERYLQSGYARRLPEDMRAAIGEHGIRNSHLLSIAPTGTISLSFADNASSGIEPAYSWLYRRRKRDKNGNLAEHQVQDYAYRLYLEHRGRRIEDDTLRGAEQAPLSKTLPPAFVSALEVSPWDHLKMVAAVAPFVDSAISKTINVPADYPYEKFKDLYWQAWRCGVKALATYRPNHITGAIYSLNENAASA
jgi:ribonucleoside-diphosphate reductase alpha chain